MNIKQLNESLQYYNEVIDLVDNLFPLNEMAIYYGTNHGYIEDALQAIQKLNDLKEGYVTCGTNLIVRQPVTQAEINAGLYQPIQKDILVDKQIPVIFVWGEPDKIKGNKKLEGHGLVHILQGHKRQFKEVINNLVDCLVKQRPAKLDKSGNYSIINRQYRFYFALQYENDLVDHAVLISAFKAI